MEVTEKIMELAKEIGGICDKPFTDETITVLRHGVSGKWFGILLEIPQYFFGGEGSEIGLDLKCPPDIGYLLRENFEGIKPAYHMNKEHWITIRLDGSVPYEEIEKLVALSYDVTATKPKNRKKQ